MSDPERPAPSILIIVPRERPDLDRSLRRSFGDDTGVQLITDRRHPSANGKGQPAAGERRLQASRDAALDAGRWIVVPRSTRRLDLSDPDVRAILFLCCGAHVVACEACQDTYRFQWIRPDERGPCVCPRCGNDLSAAAAAHTETCVYWATRTHGRTSPMIDAAAG